MCKSYKSVLSLICCFLGGASVLLAQAAVDPTAAGTSKSTPDPKTKPRLGYVRFWNMLPKGAKNLDMVQKNAAPDAPPFSTAEPLNYYATYVGVAPQQYKFAFYEAGDRVTPLQSFDVLLRKDVYVTFVATEEGGKPKVEMIDDTFDPTAEPAGKLTVRNHFPDAKVSVVGNNTVQSRQLTSGETQVLEGFPLSVVYLQMQATLKGGKIQRWSTEVDFRDSKHASLLVVPDPYGRFRPRVSPDGPSLAAVVVPPNQP